MSDKVQELERLAPSFRIGSSEEFKVATSQIGRELRLLNKDQSEISLSQILNKVIEWEAEFGDKVKEEEIESLEVLSMMIGMVKFSQEHRRTDEARLSRENVDIEHQVLRVVFNNLEPDGKPNETIMRSFSLVTGVFDTFFDMNTSKISDKGILKEMGYWQGAMAAVTTAVMFNNAGWEVRLPTPEMDIESEVDLVVVNPKGERFTVDITARRPGHDKSLSNEDDLFYIKTGDVRPEIAELSWNFKGNIKINIPPLASRESDTFYENRRTGYPNERAIAKFKGMISS